MISTKSRLILKGKTKEHRINCLAIQSPLAGVSDHVFRKLIRKWAPKALLFTEMVNATSLNLGHGTKKIAKLSKELGPIGVQLFDYRPDAMAEAAKQAEAAGAFLIDINMGCPVKKISKKGGGSGLLKDASLAAKIVTTVANAVDIPVTVKTRLGWDEASSDPISFGLRLQDAGAQLLTLHGRTREQGFNGKADWESIAKVKAKLSIPVIANGDIRNPDNALQCLQQTNADGIMIGRGSMGAPWLIGQIDLAIRGEPIFKTPSAKEKIIITLEHLNGLIESNGDHGLLIARKHINWTISGFPGSSDLRKSLVRIESPFKAIKLLEESIKSVSS